MYIKFCIAVSLYSHVTRLTEDEKYLIEDKKYLKYLKI